MKHIKRCLNTLLLAAAVASCGGASESRPSEDAAVVSETSDGGAAVDHRSARTHALGPVAGSGQVRGPTYTAVIQFATPGAEQQASAAAFTATPASTMNAVTRSKDEENK